MALKAALLSFEFESVKINGGEEIVYSPQHDFDFSQVDPLPNEAIQPIVQHAFSKIKRCIAKTVSATFYFGSSRLINFNNFLHIGSSVITTEIQLSNGSYGQTSIVFSAKFYKLEPSARYKVSIELEELPVSSLGVDNPDAFRYGAIDNKNIEKLAHKLDQKFDLNGCVEFIPIIKRGRTDTNRYLVSSDDRVMEYDFEKVVYHKKSEFQDIKVVSSPSLGNTLVLDNLQNMAEVDQQHYTETLMDKQKVSYRDKDVLILGGGDGGLLWELLKQSPKFVTMAEIDISVIEACRGHLKPFGESMSSLEGPNHKIIVDDCKKVLRKLIGEGKKFDVIFNDLTDIPVAKREESLTAFEPDAHQKDNPWHFIEAIFNLSLDCLKPDGLYMTHASGLGNTVALEAYEEFLANCSIPVEFEKRNSYVPSYMEIWVFYTIKKKL